MSSASSRAVPVIATVLAAAVAVLVAGAWSASTTAAASLPALRVCADPNNLPFSNEAGEGVENALARLIASDLGRPLDYTWWPQRRGFIRTTLNAGACDVVMGVPSEYELALTTRPYYRSTYVFVWRADGGAPVRSLDDPRLRHLRIGLHTIGDDYANVPPAEALARRGIVDNVHGYSIYGNYARPNPPADLLAAVARGEIDVAIAWGPLAGYFASREEAPLSVAPVEPATDGPLRFVFDISMAVRRGDVALRDRLDQAIGRHRAAIAQLLRAWAVPVVSPAAGPTEGGPS